MKRFFFIALFLIAIAPASRLNAALPVGSEDINISVTPTTPGPLQKAHASLDSSVTDLSRATVTWKLNGTVSGSGKGLTAFDFTTGDLGARTTITALISSPDGSFTKEITLSSNSIDLLWQGNG